ncbi:MAG: GNAT family N-acetyltransferase [Gammaproteobacteria bacterium]|nr:GNAT family N-acetyltransferase [Gammaproteobacteria bacterium]
MHQIVTGTLRDAAFARHYAPPMFRLRYRVFHERLGWDVKAQDGVEKDEFDDLHTLYIVAAELPGGRTLGGWRLRPTTLPYMMADVAAFAPLLHGQAAPRTPDVWEISRFAVDADAGRAHFGFNAVAREMIRATIQFGADNGIGQYVMVVSAAVERLLRNAGLVLHRFGPPRRIGAVLSVACTLNLDAQTRHAILGHPLETDLRRAA